MVRPPPGTLLRGRLWLRLRLRATQSGRRYGVTWQHTKLLDGREQASKLVLNTRFSACQFIHLEVKLSDTLLERLQMGGAAVLGGAEMGQAHEDHA